jgi:hypothetical protein
VSDRELTGKELMAAIRREPVRYGENEPVKLLCSWAGLWPAIWEREWSSRWRHEPGVGLVPRGKP